MDRLSASVARDLRHLDEKIRGVVSIHPDYRIVLDVLIKRELNTFRNRDLQNILPGLEILKPLIHQSAGALKILSHCLDERKLELGRRRNRRRRFMRFLSPRAEKILLRRRRNDDAVSGDSLRLATRISWDLDGLGRCHGCQPVSSGRSRLERDPVCFRLNPGFILARAYLDLSQLFVRYP